MNSMKLLMHTNKTFYKFTKFIVYAAAALFIIWFILFLGTKLYYVYMIHGFEKLPSHKLNYIPEEMRITIDFVNKYVNTDEELEASKAAAEKNGAPYREGEIKADSETIKKFSYIMNSFELADITDEFWKTPNRKIIDDRHEKFYNEGNSIYIFVVPENKSEDFALAGSYESDTIVVFDRYIKTFTPWDGTDKWYYIKNYDKNDPPVEQIRKIIK